MTNTNNKAKRRMKTKSNFRTKKKTSNQSQKHYLLDIKEELFLKERTYWDLTSLNIATYETSQAIALFNFDKFHLFTSDD